MILILYFIYLIIYLTNSASGFEVNLQIDGSYANDLDSNLIWLRNINIKIDASPTFFTGKIFSSCNGGSLVNASLLIQSDLGTFVVGNGDWVGSSLTVNPRLLAVGVIYQDGCWQYGTYNNLPDNFKINPIVSSKPFTSDMFYMGPKLSYYLPDFIDKYIHMGASYGYSTGPSQMLDISKFFKKSTYRQELTVTPKGEIAYSAHLFGVAADYDNEKIKFGLAIDAIYGTSTGVDIGFGAMFRYDGGAVAISAGYLYDDPRVSFNTPSSSYYFDSTITNSINIIENTVKHSVSYFFSSTTIEGMRIKTHFIASGCETEIKRPYFALAPFLEIGMYLNEYGGGNQSEAEELEKRINDSDTGFVCFFGTRIILDFIR